MSLSREDYKDVKGSLGKALAKKVSKVTRDNILSGRGKYESAAEVGKAMSSNGTPRLRAHTAKLRAEGKLHKSKGMAPDNPFRNVTHVDGKRIR